MDISKLNVYDARAFKSVSMASKRHGCSRLNWVRKMLQIGLHRGCRECERPTLKGHGRCAKHLLRARLTTRRYNGTNPWHKGSRGVPPRYSDAQLLKLQK